MTLIRGLASALCVAGFVLFASADNLASQRPPARAAASAHPILHSLAGWLETSGEEGAMGAEVADALKVPRLASEQTVSARQIAFRSGETLHLAQVLADDRSEFVMLMVKRPDRITFYLSTLDEGFKRAVVSVPVIVNRTRSAPGTQPRISSAHRISSSWHAP